MKVNSLGGLFSKKLIVQRRRYKLASKFTQSNSVSRSVYAYAIGTIVDRKCKNRSKCYLGVSGANDSSTPGVCVLFFGKLLDTIYLSIDLFWNDISLRYIFMINGLKGCCWQLCTLLFTLHFYWLNLGLDLVEMAGLQKHIHLKEQWKWKNL